MKSLCLSATFPRQAFFCDSVRFSRFENNRKTTLPNPDEIAQWLGR